MDVIEIYNRSISATDKTDSIPCVHAMDIVRAINRGEDVNLDGNIGKIISIWEGDNTGEIWFCNCRILMRLSVGTNSAIFIPVSMGH